MTTLTPQQCRDVDRYAIEVLGIPGVVLMENAGRNATDVIERIVKRTVKDRPIRSAIVCGKGNNGGDGFVIARHLMLRGHHVTIDLMAQPSTLTGDAAINCAIAERMNIQTCTLNTPHKLQAAARRWRQCDVVVDALFGTGLQGALTGFAARVVERINALEGSAIVAIDVPSGLDAERGVADGPAIQADHTVTFLAKKNGYTKREAKQYLGKVNVADIGAPLTLILDAINK